MGHPETGITDKPLGPRGLQAQVTKLSAPKVCVWGYTPIQISPQLFFSLHFPPALGVDLSLTEISPQPVWSWVCLAVPSDPGGQSKVDEGREWGTEEETQDPNIFSLTAFSECL